MSEIVLLNSKFEESGKVNVKIDLGVDKINKNSVHQVVKATLANRRQGTAATRTKSMVQGGGKKPFKQKGTGRARQGSSRSPLMPGGGTAFGPQPRDYSQKVNKKTTLKAIHSVLADKYQAGKLTVVDHLVSTGKTKEIFKFLSGKGLTNCLIVTDSRESLVLRAARNLKTSKALAVEGFSVYEAIKFENLLIERSALENLIDRLV